MALPAVRLAKFAERLPAYNGATAARLHSLKQYYEDLAEQQSAQALQEADTAVARRADGAPELLLPGPQIPGATVVPATPAALAVSDLRDLFSFGTG